MPMIPAFLEAQAFDHIENDEPHEDHWILEGMPNGLQILAEEGRDGWKICRNPRDDEPKGEWTPIGDALSDEGAIAIITKELQDAGIAIAPVER